MKKSTKIVRNILLFLVSLSFLMGGITKIIGVPTEVSMFAAIHLQRVLIIIGVLEVLVAIGLWFPKARTISILFVTAIMGAAVAETLSLGTTFEIISPGLILLLAWIIYYIDHKQYSVEQI